MPRFGVIDLGTNTFHLLIAEQAEDGTFAEVFREQRFIKLGEGGLHELAEGPMQEGFKTVLDFRELLSRYRVEQVRTIGTAALRTARNGPQFIQRIKAATGLEIELISGVQEAALIFRGVSAAVPFSEQPYLVIDIGGGSVELILASRDQVYYSRSFPAGLAVLKQRFPFQGPYQGEDVRVIQEWLTEQFGDFEPALREQPPVALVGAAGTFDVLEDMLASEKPSPVYSVFPSSDFFPLYRRMLSTTFERRLQFDKLPASRADMFVLALILIDYFLQKTCAAEVIVSRYAMKEGVLAEMFEREL